ncbi:MAG: 7-carboxy-7-deazaguanine synthase QueE [Candidatus Omnitrophota bacterium]|jgi:organic radical activating enzyme
MRARISEVFESIQGEGLYFGERQIFVRFFGCNLSCHFCDTKLEDFDEYEPHELLYEINSHPENYHAISFTGGEPLLQKDFLKEALYYTRCYGYRNYLETNGTLPDELSEVIDFLDIIAMDLKLPSSAGLEKSYWEKHRDFLKIASRKQVFLKAVISGSTSEEDLVAAIDLIKEADQSAVLVLQPDSNEDYALLEGKLEGFKDICTREGITACIIPQLHKRIGIK